MITNISIESFAEKKKREIEGLPEGHEKSIFFKDRRYYSKIY